MMVFQHCYNFNNDEKFKFKSILNFVLIIKIMLYIPKINDCLETFTDEEAKHFVVINFSEPIEEEKNLRKVAESL